MDKRIGIIIGAVIIVGVLVLVLVKQSPKPSGNPPAGTGSNNTTVMGLDNPANPAAGNNVKIQKITGQQISYTLSGKVQTVSVTSSTKIVKQVNDHGLYKDVTLKFSDLKVGQIIQIILDKTGKSATFIRLLQ